MEPTTRDKEIESRLTPPRESALSTILNGAGNGAFLGAVPFLIYEGFAIFSKKPMPDKDKRIAFVAGTIGSTIGGIFGLSEARKTDKYRRTLRSEIIKINQRLDSVNAPDATAAKNWQEKVSNPTGIDEAPERS
jgi:hypothetical protein